MDNPETLKFHQSPFGTLCELFLIGGGFGGCSLSHSALGLVIVINRKPCALSQLAADLSALFIEIFTGARADKTKRLLARNNGKRTIDHGKSRKHISGSQKCAILADWLADE